MINSFSTSTALQIRNYGTILLKGHQKQKAVSTQLTVFEYFQSLKHIKYLESEWV